MRTPIVETAYSSVNHLFPMQYWRLSLNRKDKIIVELGLRFLVIILQSYVTVIMDRDLANVFYNLSVTFLIISQKAPV